MVKKVGRFTFGNDGKVDEMATAVDNFQQEAEERLLDRLVSPETARALDETIPEYLSGINSQLVASLDPYPEIALGLPLNHGLPLRRYGESERRLDIGFVVSRLWLSTKVKKGPGKGRIRRVRVESSLWIR